MVGKTLGGVYEIRARIGEGGMGSVYEAVHVHLEKPYAIKVLHPNRLRNPKALRRFLVEAKAASQIDHENIVRIVNFVTQDDGQVFIVMERLLGEDLADRLVRGPLPVDAAIGIATQVASALQAAHDNGILHRDLKPENIFLDRRHGKEVVKVLDFGISKFIDDELQLTATDQMIGTPLYVSPEVARGDGEIDHRSDIYALAAITYEMVTGHPPFSGDNQFQLIWKHGNEPPPTPTERGTQLPPTVERTILKGLAKDPGARFDSMNAFSAALTGQKVVESTTRSPSQAVPWAALGLVALVAALAWTVLRPDAGVMTPAPEPSEKPADPAPIAATPRKVTVRLESFPTGAKTLVNGEIAGETPSEVILPEGTEAAVRFSLAGYEDAEQTIRVTPDLVVRSTLKKRSPRRTRSPIKQEF